MKLILQNVGEFRPDQKEFLGKAVSLSENVINWEKWQTSVRAVNSFSETRLNGSKVLAMMAAADISLNLKAFHALSNTIAYTFLHGVLINLNDKYIDDFMNEDGFGGLAKMSGALVHEIQHVNGFTHRSWFGRNNSVPYKMQHIWESCFVDYYSKPVKDNKVSSLAGIPTRIELDVRYLGKLF